MIYLILMIVLTIIVSLLFLFAGCEITINDKKIKDDWITWDNNDISK